MSISELMRSAPNGWADLNVNSLKTDHIESKTQLLTGSAPYVIPATNGTVGIGAAALFQHFRFCAVSQGSSNNSTIMMPSEADLNDHLELIGVTPVAGLSFYFNFTLSPGSTSNFAILNFGSTDYLNAFDASGNPTHTPVLAYPSVNQHTVNNRLLFSLQNISGDLRWVVY
jgi:hypothetical protein